MQNKLKIKPLESSKVFDDSSLPNQDRLLISKERSEHIESVMMPQIENLFKEIKKRKKVSEIAKRICDQNLYLLDEIEVKEILRQWQIDRDMMIALSVQLQKK